jgi:hypothetical protein
MSLKMTPHLRRAARIFFWLALLAAALLVVHVVAVLVCRYKKLPAPPRALEVPRIELWVALAVLQPFCQACGRTPFPPCLFKTDHRPRCILIPNDQGSELTSASS